MIRFKPSGLIRRFGRGAFALAGPGFDSPRTRAHLAFCAIAILRRPAALIFRRLAGAGSVGLPIALQPSAACFWVRYHLTGRVCHDSPTRVIALVAINTLLGADVSGNWTGTMETNGRRVPIYLTLKQNDDGVSGTVVTGSDTRQVPIQKAEFRGDELAFEVHDNLDRLVSFRLKLSDTKRTGEANVQGQVSKVSLSHPVGDAAISLQTVREGAFRVSGGVSAPTLVHKVEPDYTEEARAAKLQGTVV